MLEEDDNDIRGTVLYCEYQQKLEKYRSEKKAEKRRIEVDYLRSLSEISSKEKSDYFDKFIYDKIYSEVLSLDGIEYSDFILKLPELKILGREEDSVIKYINYGLNESV